MPQPFNPIKELVRVEGASIHVLDPRKNPYLEIKLGDDLVVQVIRHNPISMFPQVEQHVMQAAAGLQAFAKRTKLTEPTQIVAAYVQGVAQSRNRQNFPKRGDKTK